MNSAGLGLAVWSYGLAGVAYSAFALHLLRAGTWRQPGQWASRLLLLAVAASALWGWCGVADPFAATVLFIRLGAQADLLAYGGWFAFFLALLRPSAQAGAAAGSRGLAWVAALVVLGCGLLQLLLALRIGGVEAGSRPVLLGWMVLPVLGLVLVEQLLRNLHEDALWNAKPLCLGLGAVFLFDLYLFSQAVLFHSLDADAADIRGAVRALVVPLLLLSTTRRKGWLVRIRLSRTAAFHSATLLLAGAYLLFMSAVGYYVRYFGGEWGRALQLGLVFVALVLATTLALSRSVRARLRVVLGKHFFRYRYDYRDEWLRFTQTLSSRPSPQQMGEQVIRGLADMLESPGGALWTQGANTSAFRQSARWNMAQRDEAEDESASLCSFLRRTGWVVNLEEYRSIPRRYDGLALPAWLLGLRNAWLVVPLCVGDELIGFVVLASARTDIEVNWEVNDLLKTAGRQAASFLAQMQATEALLEVRKFDAFNRMSAFVVHDLKNIVTQLSLMTKNAQRLHANPEFQRDMLMTIENSVEKMRQLMLQLREGATPPGAAFGVDLGALAQRIAASAAQRAHRLELGLGERVLARGHEERLERVIGHVVQNAFDATGAQGRVWLKVDRSAGQARVVVGDTGHGMSPEFMRERLFKPFQTTKQAGMGIGAYESFQYVQELGGRIDVQSEPGKGTEVSLLLPLFEAHDESALHMARVP
ncbi:MAG TPA: PEP-CTERM system histidine kinase PrsK [Rubrivivax sp.]|nr:PEP-CTERM system histidine kinase PrsK [Rubrivivax sp.]HPO18664.1 PEP-CTERM system histidine kinase PrsK [Rubrivivax sp.]